MESGAPAPSMSKSLSLSLSCIARVAPHCVNTLMILHVAHSKFLRPRAEGGGSLGLSPGVGERVIAEVDAGRRHLGEVAVHLR